MRLNRTTVSDLVQNSYWTMKRSITSRPHTASVPCLTQSDNGQKSNTHDNSLVNYMKKVYENRCSSAHDHTRRSTSVKTPAPKALIPKNYYELLGVKQSASTNDVKKAYYQLAKFYHPDMPETNAEKSAKFKEISEAYSTLVDESKRYEYDKFGRVKSKQSISHETTAQTNVSNNKSTSAMIVPKVCCETATDEIVIPITFIQAALGTKRDINVSAAIVCQTCKENNKPQSKVKLCNYCSGRGTIADKSGRDITCKLCKGARYQFMNVCTECGGRGTIAKKHRYSISIPIGAVNDQLIKVLHPSKSKHIFMRLKVEPNKVFTRKDFDVHSAIEIPFTTAILGGDVKVKTVHGDTVVKVLPGTECHSIIRIPGHGIQKPTVGNGDHVINVVIKMPKNLTSRQKSLLLSFDDKSRTDDTKTEHQERGTAAAENLTKVSKAGFTDRTRIKQFVKKAKQMR